MLILFKFLKGKSCCSSSSANPASLNLVAAPERHHPGSAPRGGCHVQGPPCSWWLKGEAPSPPPGRTGAGLREAVGALTFSLDTWWEKGHVPSVFLHVPRRNLRGGKRVSGAAEGGVKRPPRPPTPFPQARGAGAKSTWCTRPPCRGRGCRGSAGRGGTCRSGCSTCSTPASACAAAASPAARWPSCAAPHGCGQGQSFVSLGGPPPPPHQPGSPGPNPGGRTWPGSGCSCRQGPRGLWAKGPHHAWFSRYPQPLCTAIGVPTLGTCTAAPRGRPRALP